MGNRLPRSGCAHAIAHSFRARSRPASSRHRGKTRSTAFTERQRRETSPLSTPLQTVAPAPGGWTPLLFLNATSDGTGRRVILTPVRMTEPTTSGNALFIDAYDLHELLCSPYLDPKTNAYPEISTLDEIAHFLPLHFSPVAGAQCDNKKPTWIDIRLTPSQPPQARDHPSYRLMQIFGIGSLRFTDSVVDGGFFNHFGRRHCDGNRQRFKVGGQKD